MSQDLSTQIKIGADASGVEAGVGRAKKSLASLGGAAKQAGKEAGGGFDMLGAGGDKAAKRVDSATRSMQNSIQRLAAEQKAGEKNTRAYFEALADQKGINRNALKPFLDDLDAAKAKTIAATKEANSFGESLRRVGPAAAAMFAGFSIAGIVGKVTSVQREFDVLNSSLITVTGSSAAAAKEMEWLKQFAKETPFGLAQATQGFVKMKALGLDPSRAALTSFGNTASAMGKDLNQMIEAVADAATGQFERLKEFGIKSSKEGDKVSFTFQGVTKTIKNSADEISRYLQDIGDTEFGGAMATRAATLDGAIAGLGDTWDELFRTISTQGVGSLIYDSVTMASGAIEDATTILRAMTEATEGTSTATGALVSLQGGVATFFETVAVLAANTLYVLKQTGDTLGGVAAGYKAFFSFDFDAVRAIGADMKANAEQARREIDATTDRILSARKRAQIAEGYAAWNASAATDPRRLDLPKIAPRPASGGGGGASKGSSRAPGAAVSAYATLIESIKQKIEAEKLEMESGERLTASQRERLKIDSDIATGKLKISAAQKAALTAGLEELALLEQQKAAAKEAMKIAQATQAARSKEADGIKAWFEAQENAAAQAIKSAKDRIGSLEGEEEAAKLSAAQNITLAQAIERTALARLREKQGGFREGSDGFNALQKEIEARERIIELIGAKDQREAADASNKALVQQWDETVKQYDDIFRTGFADMLNNGKDGWKSFTKSLATTFKTAVADQLYKSFAQPFVVKIVASLLGITGGGAAMAGGGGAGGVGGLANGAKTAYDIYSMGSKAATWLGFGSAAAGAGAGIGLSAGAAGVTGLTGSVAGAGYGFASGAAGLGMTAGSAGASAIGGSLGAGAAGAGAAGAASSVMSMAAAAGPWIAGAIALYSIIKSFDDSGTLHMGAGAVYNGKDGLKGGADLYGQAAFGMGAKGEYNAAAQANVDSIAQGLGVALDGVAVSFGQTAGYEIATAFADDSSKDGAWGSLRISKDGSDLLNWEDTRKSKWAPKEFSDGEGGYKEYLAAVAKDTRQVLLDMDLPSWADTMLNSIGEAASMDQLAGTIAQIGQIQTAFVMLGTTIDGFAGMADKTFEALMKASGGFGNLQQSLSSYYENYYTEAERMGKATASLAAELAKSGVSMPASKEAYRALVEQQLAAGEGGAELAAKLLQLGGAFAQVADYAEQAAKDAIEAAKAAAEKQLEIAKAAAEKLRNVMTAQRAQEIQYMELLGDASGALAARRADELAAMDPLLREVQSYLNTMADLSAAMSKNKSEMDSLQDSLNSMTGAVSKTVQQVLGDLMARLQDTKSFRGNLQGTIEGARMSGMENSAKVSYLRGKETSLWGQLNGAANPTEVAEKLQQTILDRIGIEAALRETVEQKTLDGLRAQLDVVQSMRDAVAGMQSSVDSLRIGPQSALNPYDQLQYAGGKFDAAYAKAQGGDMDAWKDVQSYGSSYVQLGRDNYASSTDSAEIFFKVTEAMDQLIGMGMDADPQITALNTQISLLQTVDQSGKANAFASEQQVIQLTGLDTRMAQIQERQQASVDKQLALAQQQIDELKKSNDLLQAQITQQAAMAAESRETQQTQSKELAALRDSARMAEAAV